MHVPIGSLPSWGGGGGGGGGELFELISMSPEHKRGQPQSTYFADIFLTKTSFGGYMWAKMFNRRTLYQTFLRFPLLTIKIFMKAEHPNEWFTIRAWHHKISNKKCFKKK